MAEPTSRLSDLLFLDIETVPQSIDFDELDTEWKSLWEYKSRFIARNNESPKELYNRAGIYAEFGKIICISVGYLNKNGPKQEFRIKSFSHESEYDLLKAFEQLLRKHFNKSHHKLVAHNGKEFDFPFIARRMLINGIQLPQILNLSGKKPWEIGHIDTLELWKFGDYKHYTSLRLLAKVFGLPSPKDDIDGSQVAEVYYQNKDLKRIVNYCENDVLTLANLYLKIIGKPIITEDEIVKSQ
jgi:uncharacterized protein YprB with RNaseH-like and TPR domain